MKKPLRHCDIAEGKRYKVVRKPIHLKDVQYPYLNVIGIAKWSSPVGGVLMCFGHCKERIVPVECLEEVNDETPEMNNQSDKAIDPNHGLLTFYGNLGLNSRETKSIVSENKESVVLENIKLNELYRIVKTPSFWSRIIDAREYPFLGQIGRLVKIHKRAGTLKLGDGTQRFVPFSCMEAVKILIPPAPVIDLSDDKLIDVILANPVGCLKIIKGLAKMNKEPRLIAFVQRGILV